jgi:hypothetical protein
MQTLEQRILGITYRVNAPGGASIRIKPDDNAPVAWLMSNRSQLVVCEISGDWAKVAIPIEAWIRREQLVRNFGG